MIDKILQFNCPSCGKIRNYINEISFLKSVRKKLKCNVCCQLGKKYPNRKSPTLTDEQRKKMIKNLNTGIPWNKGKVGIYSKETIEKIRQKSIGRKHKEETKKCISEKLKNRIISNETRLKMSKNSRIYQLKRLTELQIPPHEDRGSREYFQSLNEKGFNFKSKTFFELGYVADGYDENNHIWVEFDTPYHRFPTQKEKDIIRQQNIIEHFEQIKHPLKQFIRVSANKTGCVLNEECVYEGNV